MGTKLRVVILNMVCLKYSKWRSHALYSRNNLIGRVINSDIFCIFKLYGRFTLENLMFLTFRA